jgi:glycosyltransferase involved in cell wall biosynthesis
VRILHVIDMGTTCGGAERLVASLVARQRAAGHQVTVLSTDLPGSGERFNDVGWHRVDPSVDLRTRIRRQLRNPQAHAALAGLVERWRPDVAHLHTILLMAPSSLRALADTPTVQTIHGPELYVRASARWCLPSRYVRRDDALDHRIGLTWRGRLALLGARWVVAPVWRRALRVVDVRTAPSAFQAALVARDLGPTVVVPNGVDGWEADRGAGGTPAGAPRLLFSGRLESAKGAHVLLAAMPAVLTAHPTARLTVCGSGSREPLLRRMIDELGLGHAVEMAGWLGQDELTHQVAAADVLVVPSLWPEAFALACLEALAVGTPVVAAAVGALPDLVRDGETGLLVPPGNAAALAAAICRLLADGSLRRRLGEGGRRLAAGYTLTAHAEAVEAIYADAIRRHAARHGRPEAAATAPGPGER